MIRYFIENMFKPIHQVAVDANERGRNASAIERTKQPSQESNSQRTENKSVEVPQKQTLKR